MLPGSRWQAALAELAARLAVEPQAVQPPRAAVRPALRLRVEALAELQARWARAARRPPAEPVAG